MGMTKSGLRDYLSRNQFGKSGDLFDAADATLEAAIHEVRSGRTAVNFSHVPEVIRALEWVWMDLDSMREELKKKN